MFNLHRYHSIKLGFHQMPHHYVQFGVGIIISWHSVIFHSYIGRNQWPLESHGSESSLNHTVGSTLMNRGNIPWVWYHTVSAQLLVIWQRWTNPKGCSSRWKVLMRLHYQIMQTPCSSKIAIVSSILWQIFQTTSNCIWQHARENHLNL